MKATLFLLLVLWTGKTGAELITGIPYADFEDNAPVSLGGERLQPETRIEVNGVEAHGGMQSARLHYRFRQNIGPLQYVELRIPQPMTGAVRAINFWMRGDASQQLLRMRVVDADGEVHQYTWGTIDWHGWRQIKFDVSARADEHWGGSGDGIMTSPFRSIAILVDSAIRPFQSSLAIDDITYDAEGAYTDFVYVSCKSSVPGNAFYGRRPSFEITVNNPLVTAMPETPFRVVVERGDGTSITALQRNLSLAAGAGETFTVAPELTDFGLYRVIVGFGLRGQTQAFSWLPEVTSHKPDPDSPFGVSMHFGHGSRGPIEKNLQLASDMGIRWLRDDAHWSGTEQTKGVYKVSPTFDRFLRIARPEYGCEPLVILDYSNALYEKNRSVETETGRQAFAAWSEFMARTYRDTVRYWEVWNEPNTNHFWEPRSNPAAYARLLKATYPAVKRGNPDAVVIAMATAGLDLGFIENVLKEGAVGSFDAVSVHAYHYPAAPEQGGRTMVEHLGELVELLARYGAAGTPIFNTEVGWPNQDDPRGVPEHASADYLARMYIQLYAIPEIKANLWYDFQNDGTRRDFNEHNFGLLHHDFTPKAPAIACRMTSMMLRNTRFVRRLETGAANVHAYQFAHADNRTLVAAWCVIGTASLTTRWEGAPLRSVSASGPIRPIRARGNLVVTELGTTPLFLEGRGKVECLPAVVTPGSAVSAPRHTVEIPMTLHNRQTRPVTGTQTVEVPDGWLGPAAKQIDIPPEKDAGSTLRITVGADAVIGRTYPIVLRWRDDAGELFGVESAAVSIRPPATLSLAPMWTPQGFALVLSGRSTLEPPPVILRAEVKGMETWGGQTKTILEKIAWVAADESRFRVLVPCPPGAVNAHAAEVAAELRLADGNTVTATREISFWRPLQKTMTADGSTADWKGVPTIPVTIFDGLHQDLWKDAADCSALLQLAWDTQALYLCLRVTDETHGQAYTGTQIWKGDSIQLALSQQSEPGVSSGSRTEFGFALTPTGERTFRWTEPRGPVDAVTCSIRRDGGETLYEAAIPWSELGIAVPSPGTTLGFALVVNDNDSGIREGWLRLFNGIAWRKDPSQFGTLFF